MLVEASSRRLVATHGHWALVAPVFMTLTTVVLPIPWSKQFQLQDMFGQTEGWPLDGGALKERRNVCAWEWSSKQLRMDRNKLSNVVNRKPATGLPRKEILTYCRVAQEPNRNRKPEPSEPSSQEPNAEPEPNRNRFLGPKPEPNRPLC